VFGGDFGFVEGGASPVHKKSRGGDKWDGILDNKKGPRLPSSALPRVRRDWKLRSRIGECF